VRRHQGRSASNCGTCGHACAQGQALQRDGLCSTGCVDGETACNGSCTQFAEATRVTADVRPTCGAGQVCRWEYAVVRRRHPTIWQRAMHGPKSDRSIAGRAATRARSDRHATATVFGARDLRRGRDRVRQHLHELAERRKRLRKLVATCAAAANDARSVFAAVRRRTHGLQRRVQGPQCPIRSTAGCAATRARLGQLCNGRGRLPGHVHFGRIGLRRGVRNLETDVLNCGKPCGPRVRHRSTMLARSLQLSFGGTPRSATACARTPSPIRSTAGLAATRARSDRHATGNGVCAAICVEGGDRVRQHCTNLLNDERRLRNLWHRAASANYARSVFAAVRRWTHVCNGVCTDPSPIRSTAGLAATRARSDRHATATVFAPAI